MSEIAANNKAIKFPSHHYVGFQSRPSADNCPLGFMTPDGTDSAAKKRKETVDTWAQGYNYHATKKDVVPSVTYENKPMVGFKLSRSIRRDSSFGSGNVKWRIEDPRGFELEISSPNFAQILLLCTMERGEIQEQLIWGRLGSENVLVPVDSDAYRAATVNTERASKKASLKDMDYGDKVVMQNGDEGFFMGIFYFIRGSGTCNGFSAKVSDKKRYVFAKTPGSTNSYNYFALATPKVAEIIKADKLGSIEDNERELNKFLANKKDYWNRIIENTTEDGYVIGVTAKKPDPSDITITKTSHLLVDLVAGKKPGKMIAGFLVGVQGLGTVGFDLNAYCTAVKAGPPANAWSSRNDAIWVYAYDTAAYQAGEFKTLTTSRHGYTSQEQHLVHMRAPGATDTYDVITATAKTAYSGDIVLPLNGNY
jgi:hypothetical protein